MSLVPHKIVALNENNEGAKNTIAGAVVSLFDSSGAAVTLFDDEAGSNGSTTKQTDSQGAVVVWVTAGEYDEEVNGSVRRKVSVGGNSVISYPDTASLQTSRPTKTGQRAENRERANAQYELAASGYTAQPGDVVAANGRVWALSPSGHVSLEMVGYTGLVEEGAIFEAAKGVAKRKNLPLMLGPITLLSDGGHDIDETIKIVSLGFTMKRATAGYTGTSPLLTVSADSVTIDGDITFDGNNPDEAGAFGDSYASFYVSGDNFKSGKIKCINTPMPAEGAKQLRGCRVDGDNFHCDDFYGGDSGYASLQLYITKDLDSFYVGKFVSKEHNYKGFQINGDGTFTINSVEFGSVYTETSTTTGHDASEGILVDTDSDNTLIQVKNFNVGFAHLVGGQSNCLKVQNVENFYCGDMKLDVQQTYTPGQAMRMHAKNCHIDKLWYNGKKVRLYSVNSYFGEVIAAHDNSQTESDVWRFEDSSGEVEFTDARHHAIKKLQIENNPSITYVFALSHDNAIELNFTLDEVICPDVPLFGHFDLGGGGQDAIRDGRIYVGKVTGLSSSTLYTSNTNYSKWIQVGERTFKGATVPTIGTYRVGDYVKNTSPSVVGGAYINKGWICTVAGDEGAFEFEIDRVNI